MDSRAIESLEGLGKLEIFNYVIGIITVMKKNCDGSLIFAGK
jgi:hypothetical protein